MLVTDKSVELGYPRSVMTPEGNRNVGRGKRKDNLGFSSGDLELAKKRMEEIVIEANGKGHCEPNALQMHEDLKKKSIEFFGKASVLSSLPTDLVLFHNIAQTLFDAGIERRRDLIRTSDKDLRALIFVGPVKLKIMGALRNIYLAESKLKPPKR